jgi:ribosome-binding factor A
MTLPQFHKDRLQEDFRREIALAIANRVRDPRVPSVVTVSEILLSPDTRNATVMISIFGEEIAQKEAIDVLNKAAPFIQNIVAPHIRIKHFPRLYFKLDKSLDYREHLDDLLEKIKDDLV